MLKPLLGSALAALAMWPALAEAQTARPAARQAAPARPAPRAQPQGLQVPPAATLLILIKSTLVALDQANRTNIYHVFHALGSDSFRAARQPQVLSQQFTAFRNARVDLYPTMLLSPQLTQQPVIQQNRLHLVGYFPTSPSQINFDMWFEPSQGQWKFADVGLSVTRAPPAAPQR